MKYEDINKRITLINIGVYKTFQNSVWYMFSDIYMIIQIYDHIYVIIGRREASGWPLSIVATVQVILEQGQ